MPDIKTIADKADIVVNGYAFTREADGIHVLNLNSPDKAVVFSEDGEVLETTMDDIELSIASRYLYQNLPQIEASDIHQRLGLEKGKYILLSAHREENIDTEKNFMSRFTAINRMAENRRTSESNAKRLAA